MSKNTFKPLGPNGKRLPEVEYTPLLYTVASTTHRLALHKDLNRVLPDEMKEWVVSEPITGMRVRLVYGTYKGATVSSRGLSPKAAREAAVQTLDALVSRIGEYAFIEKMKIALRNSTASQKVSQPTT